MGRGFNQESDNTKELKGECVEIQVVVDLGRNAEVLEQCTRQDMEYLSEFFGRKAYHEKTKCFDIAHNFVFVSGSVSSRMR